MSPPYYSLLRKTDRIPDHPYHWNDRACISGHQQAYSATDQLCYCASHISKNCKRGSIAKFLRLSPLLLLHVSPGSMARGSLFLRRPFTWSVCRTGISNPMAHARSESLFQRPTSYDLGRLSKAAISATWIIAFPSLSRPVLLSEGN